MLFVVVGSGGVFVELFRKIMEDKEKEKGKGKEIQTLYQFQ